MRAPSCCSERSSGCRVSHAMLRVAMLRVAITSDGIPKREGFWSSRPLCRLVMNSIAVVWYPSSYSKVVSRPEMTRISCCLLLVVHASIHMLFVTRMFKSGECSAGRGRSVLAVSQADSRQTHHPAIQSTSSIISASLQTMTIAASDREESFEAWYIMGVESI